MNGLRKLLLGVLSFLFIVLLFATAFDVGFVKIASQPTTVKKLVAESRIYDSVIPGLLEQTKTIDTNAGTIVVTDPAIQKVANQAISPTYIQQNTESAIDSIYKWLEGDTPQPDFKIDLAAVKTNFANGVATTVEQRLAALPACTVAQTTVITQNDQFDAVNATCLPKGTTAAQAAAQVRNSIAGGEALLDKTTISADTIKSEGSDLSVFQDKLKDVPKQYQRAKMTPIILVILTILTGLGIVFLSSTWPKGLRRVGVSLLIIGVIMLAFSYSLNRGVSTQLVPKIKLDNLLLQKNLRVFVTDLTQQIDKNYWFFGGLYTVLGVGAVAAGETFRRRAQPAHPHATPATEPADTAHELPKEEPTPKPKPAKEPAKPKTTRKINVD
ncbi:hypothetical protein KW803_02690 [Candidatus Saccharibacteria bacterium]|nr:hypothetical protein [Candidatus Saccharibacteria bacterium]